jgi:hypothetical protein
VIVIRRFVHDKKAPPQGKVVLTDPNWRYQALITSMSWEPLDLWRFYNDRGDCERVFKVAKHALGMSHLVGQEFKVNSVAFLLRLLAFNADLLYQRYHEDRAREQNRPGTDQNRRSMPSIETLKHGVRSSPAAIVAQPRGRETIRQAQPGQAALVNAFPGG